MPSISSTPFTVIWERVIVLRRELSGNRKTEFSVSAGGELRSFFFEIKLKGNAAARLKKNRPIFKRVGIQNLG